MDFGKVELKLVSRNVHFLEIYRTFLIGTVDGGWSVLGIPQRLDEKPNLAQREGRSGE